MMATNVNENVILCNMEAKVIFEKNYVEQLDTFEVLMNGYVDPFIIKHRDFAPVANLDDFWQEFLEVRSKVAELGILSFLPIGYLDTRMNGNPKRDKPIFQVIHPETSNDLSRKSPDNIHIFGNALIFIECGVSSDHLSYLQKKRTKYSATEAYLLTECHRKSLNHLFYYFVIDQEGVLIERRFAHLRRYYGISPRLAPAMQRKLKELLDIQYLYEGNYPGTLADMMTRKPQIVDDPTRDHWVEIENDITDHNVKFDQVHPDGEYHDDPGFMDELAATLRERLDNGYYDSLNDIVIDHNTVKNACDKLLYGDLGMPVTDKVKPSLHIIYPSNLSNMQVPGVTTESSYIKGVFQAARSCLSASSRLDFLNKFSDVVLDENEEKYMSGIHDDCITIDIDSENVIEDIENAVKEFKEKGYKHTLKSLNQIKSDIVRYKSEEPKSENEPDSIKYLLEFRKMKLQRINAYPKFRDMSRKNMGKMCLEIDECDFYKEATKAHIKEDKTLKTLDLKDEYFDEYKEYIEYMSSFDKVRDVHEEFIREPAFEGQLLTKVKKESMDEYLPILKTLMSRKIYGMLDFYNNIANQIIFYGIHSKNNKGFTIISGGLRNHVLILAPGQVLDSDQNSRAFCQAFITDTDERSNLIFGSGIETYPMRDGRFLHISNWRRLEAFKFAHFKTLKSAVLGHSVTSLLRMNIWRDLDLEELSTEHEVAIREKMVVPTLFGACTSLNNSHFCADFRYILNNGTGYKANLEAFLNDKYKPVYKSLADVFVTMSALKGLPMLVERSRSFNRRAIEIFKGERTNDSLGATFEFPSLYTGFLITNLQDLLDHMYSYVFQVKLSSVPIYQFIEEYNVLHEFNELLRVTDIGMKYGYDPKKSNVEHVLDLIEPGKYRIGFSRQAIREGLKLNLPVINARSKIYRDLNNIDLKESTLTLARLKSSVSRIEGTETHVIQEEEVNDILKELKSEINSMFIEQWEHYKKRLKGEVDYQKFFDNLSGTLKTIYDKLSNGEPVSKFLSKYLHTSRRIDDNFKGFKTKYSKFVNIDIGIVDTGLRRIKGFIGVLDELINNSANLTVIDMIRIFLTRNVSPKFGTALKDQYGSKRIFYIQDFITRYMTYIDENYIWKRLCKEDPCEAITKPGEVKMKDLDDLNKSMEKIMMDSSDIYEKDGVKTYKCNLNMVSINGDCTKFSNAEVMDSFIALADACVDMEVMPKVVGEFTKARCLAWKTKEVLYEKQVLETLTPEKVANTPYYKKTLEETGELVSMKCEAGFLQGMFNHPASLKHTCQQYFMRDLFYRIYPDWKDQVIWMSRAHSDDYYQLVLYRTEEQLSKLRIIQKLTQRMFSLTDSTKKTVVHKHLTEFVSLYSLNGLCAYPHIKVSKDIESNLPTNGYKNDLYSAVSLSGKAITRGFSVAAAYYLQRLANVVVDDRYRLSKIIKGDRSKLPVAMGGIYDAIPLLLPATGLSLNDYRIYRYTDDGKKHLMSLIPAFSIDPTNDTLDDLDKELRSNFYSLNYCFPRSKKIIELRRKFPMSKEELNEFRDNEPWFMYCKPTHGESCIKYLKSKMYGQQAEQAFSNITATSLMVRNGYFASRKCINIKGKLYSQEEAYTMLQAHSDRIRYDESYDVLIQNYCTNYISTAVTFYDFSEDNMIKNRSDHVTYMRFKFANRNYDDTLGNCNPGLLIFYMFSPEEFNNHYPDENKFIYSELEKRFNNLVDFHRIKRNMGYKAIPLVYNLLSSLSKKSVGFYTSSPQSSLNACLTDILRYNCFHNKRLDFFKMEREDYVASTFLTDNSNIREIRKFHHAAMDLFYCLSVQVDTQRDVLIRALSGLKVGKFTDYLKLLEGTNYEACSVIFEDWESRTNVAYMKAYFFSDFSLAKEIEDRHTGHRFSTVRYKGVDYVVNELEKKYKSVYYMNHMGIHCLLCILSYKKNKYELFVDSKYKMNMGILNSIFLSILRYSSTIIEEKINLIDDYTKWDLNAKHLYVQYDPEKKYLLYDDSDNLQNHLKQGKNLKYINYSDFKPNMKLLVQGIKEIDEPRVDIFSLDIKNMRVMVNNLPSFTWRSTTSYTGEGVSYIGDDIMFENKSELLSLKALINSHFFMIYTFRKNAAVDKSGITTDFLYQSLTEQDYFKLERYNYDMKRSQDRMKLFSNYPYPDEEYVEPVIDVKASDFETMRIEENDDEFEWAYDDDYYVPSGGSDDEEVIDDEEDNRITIKVHEEVRKPEIIVTVNDSKRIARDRKQGLPTKMELYEPMIVRDSPGAMDSINVIDARVILRRHIWKNRENWSKLSPIQKFTIVVILNKWKIMNELVRYQNNMFHTVELSNSDARERILSKLSNLGLTPMGEGDIKDILNMLNV